MSTAPTLRRMTGPYVIRAGGAVLGESSDVVELSEAGHAPTYYFPRADIAMAFVDASETVTTCPLKGDASYFSIITKSTTIKDAAWSYEAPVADLAEIAGHLAFAARDDVAVEKL